MEKNALELCTWKEKSTTSDVMTIDFFLLGNFSSSRQAQLKLVTGDFVIDAEDSSYCGKRHKFIELQGFGRAEKFDLLMIFNALKSKLMSCGGTKNNLHYRLARTNFSLLLI